MNYKVKQGNIYNLIPAGFFVIIALILGVMSKDLFDDFTNIMEKITPGESITIEVTEDELYYIMIDTFERDDISVATQLYYTSLQMDYDDDTYNLAFVIYQETNTLNVVLAEELSENTSISVDNYEAILTIQFEEAGTYVIETTMHQLEYPDFSIGVTNVDIGKLILKIFMMIGIGVGSFVAMVISIAKISQKRSNSLEEQQECDFHSENYDTDYDDYGNYK